VATLLAIRIALNGEIGVVTDTETIPWTVAIRNQAISDGYAALYRSGVWKLTKQSIATVDDKWIYALTSIRRLERVELLDSDSRILETPKAVVEDDGAGAWQLRLNSPIAAGYTLRVRGWGAYISVFPADTDTDDLPAEHARVPRLKSKTILYRQQLGMFARYGERQALDPTMNMTVEQLLGIIAASEREFADACVVLSNLRPRSGQTRRL